MPISEFLQEYFIKPYFENEGYNLVNTLTYGIILILIIYLVNNVLHKYKFKVSNKLISSILPFILFGSSLRVVEDAGILPQTPLLATPGIYFVVMAFLFPT